eukprot:12852361-Alexandrium_andersonii.AAC.1
MMPQKQAQEQNMTMPFSWFPEGLANAHAPAAGKTWPRARTQRAQEETATRRTLCKMSRARLHL